MTFEVGFDKRDEYVLAAVLLFDLVLVAVDAILSLVHIAIGTVGLSREVLKYKAGRPSPQTKLHSIFRICLAGCCGTNLGSRHQGLH